MTITNHVTPGVCTKTVSFRMVIGGANSIPTKQSKNLHALWDGLLGNRYDAADIVRRAKEIKSDKATWKLSEAAGATLEPLAWLSESSEFARSNVYTPEVLAAVEAAKRSGASQVETVDLSEAYLKAAGTLAQKRAAFAAHRLAAILSEELGR
ncbi:MAG TPA: S1/P1 nuclease [Planctomycetaceae bacterium]|nr:S1/P1 nuclease [Planctomycetaceae bacterium]HQZ65197.1 S1/P1 nuclease [Planctomycetaceae bacterium]